MGSIGILAAHLVDVLLEPAQGCVERLLLTLRCLDVLVRPSKDLGHDAAQELSPSGQGIRVLPYFRIWLESCVVEHLGQRSRLPGFLIGPADAREVARGGNFVLQRVPVDEVRVEDTHAESDPVCVGLNLVDHLRDALLHIHHDFASSERVGAKAFDRPAPCPVIPFGLVHGVEEGFLTTQD